MAKANSMQEPLLSLLYIELFPHLQYYLIILGRAISYLRSTTFYLAVFMYIADTCEKSF